MKEDFKIPLLFLVTGLTWISYSDGWLYALPLHKDQQLFISNIKGYGFVILASFILYFLIRRNNRNLLTERTHLQQQTEENKRLFEVLNRVESFIIFTDKEGRITWINKAMEKHSGYKLEELKGHLANEVLHGAETSDETAKQIEEDIRAQISCTYTILNYKKNGEKYWVSLSITPLLNEKSELTGFFSIQSDITEHLTLVNQLSEQNELFRKIAWMTSHDIRRPLSSILSLVQLMKSGTKAENDECLPLLFQSSEELDQVIRTVSKKINSLDKL